ncbi:hypothetical protein B0T17DRAFT_473411, partial [Bombardia bombarda]
MASPNPPREVSEEGDDPIVASYSVFIKPELPKHRKLVVLEIVNKTSQDPAHIRVPRIRELRIKPKTGMYEVDVPVDVGNSYDRGKGVAWGTALTKSMETKRGGSLGLAGGFGVGAPPVRGGGRRGGAGGGGIGGGGDDDRGNGQLSWVEATRQGKVLRTQTLGGGESAEEVNTNHMVGVFKGKNLHLTPVSSIVHLRPVPHHLDAATEQERLSRPAAGGPAAGSAADKSAGRAIHMTLKAAMDEDGVSTETIADRLRAVQSESWQRMQWVQDESADAWGAYNECLFLRSAAGAATAATKHDGDDKGKELAAAAADGVEDNDDSGAPDLVDRVPRLKTSWGGDELLRAVSGIKKDDPKPGE